MTKMDILLGGIPRSGTTALARAVELHPDIFCWSWETALLPFLDELTRGLSMRPENPANVERMISRHLKSAIIDQREWHWEKNGIVPPVEITIDEINQLARNVSEIFQRGLRRTHTLQECTGLLRNFLGQYSDRRLIAEKSPSNVLLVGECFNLAQRWLITHREPFAVIASMLERTKADPWANIMGGEIERRIGLYIRHARGVISAKENSNEAMVLTFDDLMTDPCGCLANVCLFLQVEPTLRYLHQVRSIIGGKPTTDKWNGFTPLDRWKILRLCSFEVQALGYTEHYYRTSFTEMSRGLPTSLESQLQPLYGSFEPTELLPMRWVQRSSSFAIYAPRGVNTLTLKIHNNISAVLEVLRVQGDSTEDWHVTAYSDAGAASPLRLSRFSLTENVFGDWQIDLRGAEPIGHHGNWCLFKIDLETNFAFTPCFTFAESSDVRTMSFGLVDWRLDR